VERNSRISAFESAVPTVNHLTSAVNHAEISSEILLKLLESPAVSMEQTSRSGNSRVYRVRCQNGKEYAIKSYFQRTIDGLDRLEVEFSSLFFLWGSGIRCVPKPVSADRDRQIAVYEYVDGQKINCRDVVADDIDRLVQFACELKSLAASRDSLKLPPASEACFSVKAVAENIESRLKRLTELDEPGSNYIALKQFLAVDFIPALETIKARIIEKEGTKIFSAELPARNRTLSPSDFGFHNALKQADGRLVFLDFEYFGWDDPAKMIADFVLHPAMDLSAQLKQRFVQKMLECFAQDEFLKDRVERLYPLFGLKWCIIVLNEFIPIDLKRREFAAATAGDIMAIQVRQLEKSKGMLRGVMSEIQKFPYLQCTV